MLIIFQFLQGYPPVWTPRVDGVFLRDNPQKLIKAGKIANVPFVTGMLYSIIAPLVTVLVDHLRKYGR